MAKIEIDEPEYKEAQSAWECWAVRVILALFLAMAFNAIYNGATGGQDFGSHVTNTRQVMYSPGKWLTADITNRPLLYWIGSACVRFSHDRYGYALASMIFAFCGTAALWLLHDASRRLIVSPWLRLAGLTLIAFLPLTVVVTVVYAADTVASLPFVLAGWGLMRCLEESKESAAFRFAALAGLGFVLGNFSKATFVMLSGGVIFVMIAMWRARRISWARAGLLTLFGVILPVCAAGFILAKWKRDTADEVQRHSFHWRGTGEMTTRSWLGLKASDQRIFQAPQYLWSEQRETGAYYPLLLENNFSYFALLHLATFTDILDFSQGSTVPRREPQLTASRWAVRLGTIFSIGALLAVVAFWIKTLLGFWRPQYMPGPKALIWSSLAMAWYAPIFGTLPFVDHVYVMGYWLPRLVMPALWIFFLTFFAAVDRLPSLWRSGLTVVLCVLVAGLSAVEMRSIWYW